MFELSFKELFLVTKKFLKAKFDCSNKIRKAQNGDLKENFLTFWDLYHLLFYLESIGFS